MSFIKDDNCYDSASYVEIVTGGRPTKNITLEELGKMKLDVWDYPLTEIEHIIENQIQVVLVRFPKVYGHCEYRFCEVKKLNVGG